MALDVKPGTMRILLRVNASSEIWAVCSVEVPLETAAEEGSRACPKRMQAAHGCRSKLGAMVWRRVKLPKGASAWPARAQTAVPEPTMECGAPG